MGKKKVQFVVVFVVLVCASMVLAACAEPHVGVCQDCGAYTYTVCGIMDETREVATHTMAQGGECQVTHLQSRGAAICDECGRAWEVYGYHDCWEVHSKCGKGQVDICPMHRSEPPGASGLFA